MELLAFLNMYELSRGDEERRRQITDASWSRSRVINQAWVSLFPLSQIIIHRQSIMFLFLWLWIIIIFQDRGRRSQRADGAVPTSGSLGFLLLASKAVFCCLAGSGWVVTQENEL